MDGTSLLYAFDDPEAPERHTTQYFEVFGHRSVYHEGWIASAFHRAGMPWTVGMPPVDAPMDGDIWELYDTRTDFSQASDLAVEQPQKLAELQDVFAKEAGRAGILPLRDARANRTPMPSHATGRHHFVYHRGAIGIPETQGPPLRGCSWNMTAHIVVPAAGARGVLVTMGGYNGGMSLYLTREGRPVFVYRAFEASRLRLDGPAPLAEGDHRLEVDLDYDGGGPGRGGSISMLLDGREVASGRVERTPRGFFSIDETFDVGETTGSPVGDHPHIYPFVGGIERVEFTLR